MNYKMKSCLSAATLLLSVNTASAALTSYTGTFVIDFTENTGADIVNGDSFDFSFTYEDSTTDSAASTTSGVFTNALTDIQLIRDAGNTGSWDPVSGTFTLPSLVSTDEFATDVFEVRANGTGFTTVGVFDFDRFSLEFSGGTINDTGAGQTLLTQLGGAFDPSGFTSNQIGLIQFFESGGEGGAVAIGAISNITLTSAVPVPAAMWLFGSGLLGLVGVTRRKA